MKYFFVSENYSDDQIGRVPWWTGVLVDGYHDRDAKRVAWVIERYGVGDGKPRVPLKLTRNLAVLPEVVQLRNDFVVSDRIRQEMLDLGSACEFLEASYVNCFYIPLEKGIPDALEDDEGALRQYLRRHPVPKEVVYPRYFEVISATGSLIGNPKSHDLLRFDQDLQRGTSIDREYGLEAEVERELVERFKLVHLEGGLLCTEDAAEVIRKVADPDWLVVEEVTLL